MLDLASNLCHNFNMNFDKDIVYQHGWDKALMMMNQLIMKKYTTGKAWDKLVWIHKKSTRKEVTSKI